MVAIEFIKKKPHQEGRSIRRIAKVPGRSRITARKGHPRFEEDAPVPVALREGSLRSSNHSGVSSDNG